MKNLIKFIFVAVFAQTISFQAISQTNYFGVSGNMVAGDFDNDGQLDDIAAFNTASELPQLNIWKSHSGWMEESQAECRLPFDFLSAKSLNSKIVAGDFDNDGFIDDIASIYEVGYNHTSITVWINTDGKFTPQRWWYGDDFDANQVNQTVVAGDFDSDGFVDDIAAFYDYDQRQTKCFVWKSNSKEFAWPGTWWYGDDFNATRIQGTLVAGDFNHDGFANDIAALYDYSDDFCRIFVWTPNKNKFNWPYTWFEQEKFAAGNAKNNVIAGDFNNNGFVDNIAALYASDANSSDLLVFERNARGFDAPSTWWYGTNEAASTHMRLLAVDVNGNTRHDQITGLAINEDMATLSTWTAENHIFTLPENNWQGIALALEDGEKNGDCLLNNFADDFKIYPNPNQGKFNVEIPPCQDEWVELSVFNVLGSQVLKLQTQPGSFMPMQLDAFKSGTYVMQITGTDFTVNKNFIIE